MVYEVTDVDNDGVKWVDYVNNINYSIEYNEGERPPRSAGDVSPEQLKFIDEKVYGVPLLFVSNEQSSSITIYRVDCEEVVLDKRGRPLEMWEIILITVGSIIFGVIVIIGSLCCMKKHYANDKSGDTKSTAHLTEADGTKQYDRINTEEVELGTDEVKTENN